MTINVPLVPMCWGILAAIGATGGLIFMRCAWCKVLLGVERAAGAPGGVSDGACPKCIENLKR